MWIINSLSWKKRLKVQPTRRTSDIWNMIVVLIFQQPLLDCGDCFGHREHNSGVICDMGKKKRQFVWKLVSDTNVLSALVRIVWSFFLRGSWSRRVSPFLLSVMRSVWMIKALKSSNAHGPLMGHSSISPLFQRCEEAQGAGSCLHC